MGRVRPGEKRLIRTYAIVGWLAIAATLFSHPVGAGVVAYDAITTVGRELPLKVLTKGRLLPAGGMQWQLFIDEISVGRGLTGGDGYGYMKYTPETAGMKSVRFESGGEFDTGRLLVLEKKTRAIVIDLDPLLRGTLRRDNRDRDAEEVLEELAADFALIYIAGRWEMFGARKWLEMRGFPESVVLENKGAALFERLASRGVALYGLVGKNLLIRDAEKYFSVRLTFEEGNEDTEVRGWREVRERMAR